MLRTLRRYLLFTAFVKLLCIATGHAAPLPPAPPATIVVRSGSSVLKSLSRAGFNRPNPAFLEDIRRLNHLRSLDLVAPGPLLLPVPAATPQPPGRTSTTALATPAEAPASSLAPPAGQAKAKTKLASAALTAYVLLVLGWAYFRLLPRTAAACENPSPTVPVKKRRVAALDKLGLAAEDTLFADTWRSA